MSGTAILDPVKLSNWPVCEDCLAASDDALAVACGEIVHVLSPRAGSVTKDTSAHPQWHISSIRVNAFSCEEWPFQVLAPTGYFSIGEEQRDAVTVGLSWSSPNLGLHKRAVLAVLTSNLILALWESDGSSGQYQRTYIINHVLAHNGEQQQNEEICRRARRIRAFAWVSSIQVDGFSELGGDHLIIVNDHFCVIVLQVCKPRNNYATPWSVTTVVQCDLLPTVLSGKNPSTMSPLQRRIFETAPMTRIEQDKWVRQPHGTDDKDNLISFVSNLSIRQGTSSYTVPVSVHIEPQTYSRSSARCPLKWKFGDATAGEPVLGQQLLDATMTIPTAEYWKDSLHGICSAFNDEFKLHGHYRVRYWGNAQIAARATHAVCVTLHPADTIEHTIPSSEKCWVVFRRDEKKIPLLVQPRSSKRDTQLRILSRSAQLIESGAPVLSALDKHMLSVQKCVAKSLQDISPETNGRLMSLPQPTIGASAALNQSEDLERDRVHTHTLLGYEMLPDMSSPLSTLLETCEICSAEIPFSGDTTSATCRAGHQFTRCNLSFVAIQEPGISKYCSGCRKQFLDLVKLGMLAGPSFAEALFHAFDVCPYCQAKYHG